MKIKFIFFICIFLISCVPLYAQDTEGDIPVQAEGFGSTKSAALLEAKRSAVEQGIGIVLISETEVHNFEVQKDIILSKTSGSVKKYTVIQEEKQSDGNYHVMIEAIVSLADIKADLAALKILLESMDKPRMMVVIHEENGKIAENTILDYLTEKGFDLIDASVAAALMKKKDSLIQKATMGDPTAAAKIGAANGAEYIIVGNVKKSTGGSMYNMISGQAAITAKVIRCSDAKIIASKSATGAFPHISEDTAMEKATERAAQQLMDKALFEKIVSSFQNMANNGTSIDVTVQGVPDFKTQKAIRTKLSALPNVVSVNKRSFSEGQLKLSILFKGNADSLSESIDGQTIDQNRLSVTDIIGNRVTCRLE